MSNERTDYLHGIEHLILATPIERSRKTIQQCLVQCGWTPWQRMGEAAVATLTVVTDVGEKEAVAYLSPGSEFKSAILTGQYLTEGNNAIASAWAQIPLDAKPEEVMSHVAKWCEGAQQNIDRSYARGLYLRHRG